MLLMHLRIKMMITVHPERMLAVVRMLSGRRRHVHRRALDHCGTARLQK